MVSPCRRSIFFKITIPDTYTDIDPATIPNPFKGLEAFQETDAAYFFGREDLTEKLLDHLRQNSRFLAVVGASGSGKSSLVRAGLIPSIRQGNLPRSEEWPIAIFTPGIRPTEALAKRLLPLIGENRLLPEVMQILNGGPETLHQITESILISAPNEIRLVLVVDQFEEVFTRASQTEAVQFLDLIRHAVTIPEGRTLAILTMRADFFDRLGAYPDLAALFEQKNMVIVTDMTSENLRRSIEGPAEAVGLVYEHGLTDRILDDVRHQPGSLPLLEYALKELYVQRLGRQLTFEAYELIGGVQRALAQHANNIYLGLNAAHRDIMRRLLLRLVEVSDTGEVTRRKVHRSDLTFRNVTDEALTEVIGTLTAPESRLLIASRDVISTDTKTETWLEVSHEALIREWQQFRDRVDADKERLRYGGELLKEAQDWEKSKRNTDYLLTGSRLVQANNWLPTADATELQREFIESSISEEEARLTHERKRQRDLAQARFGVALAIALIGVIAVIFFAVQSSTQEQAAENARAGKKQAQTLAAQAENARETSETNLYEARRVQSLFLADLSRQQLEMGYPQNALLLALEALDYTYINYGNYPIESANALLNVLDYPAQEMTYSRYNAHIRGTSWNADETQLLAWFEDGTARIWDAQTGEEILALRHDNVVLGALWNADETQILSWSEDGTARTWDAQTGEEILSLRHDNAVLGALWNADETQILSWSEDGTVRTWDAQTGKEILSLRHDNAVLGALWNADETQILSWSEGGTVRIWDTQTGEQRLTLHHEGNVYGSVWNEDETKILSWSGDNTVRIWDTQTGEQLLVFRHDSPVFPGTGNGEISEQRLVLPSDSSMFGATWNADETRDSLVVI